MNESVMPQDGPLLAIGSTFKVDFIGAVDPEKNVDFIRLDIDTSSSERAIIKYNPINGEGFVWIHKIPVSEEIAQWLQTPKEWFNLGHFPEFFMPTFNTACEELNSAAR